ncbi:MAG TPA: MATE family efflux transporter, partial [Bacillota bacterium]|nr:MATE family efflux transporter [Bacillota bacterium]
MTQATEKKSLLSGILTLSIPTMLGMMLDMAYEIVDMAWVAKLSINSVAAVTIFATIWWILDIVNSIVGTSSVTIISRYFGAGNREKTVEAIEQTIIFKFLLALIVGILMS